MRALCLLLLTTGACREPFGTDRHDLVGLRIPAISVAAAPNGEVQLRTLAVAEGRPWTDEPLVFGWHDATGLDEEEIAELTTDSALATGPAPLLPAATSGPVALVVSEGESRWFGVVTIPSEPPEMPSIDGVDLLALPLTLDALTVEDLPLARRAEMTPGDTVSHVDSGGFARLRASTADNVTVRWMNTAPGGTFLELDERTADWVGGDFVADDDEIESRQAGPDGPRTVVALAMDPTNQGANNWFIREVWVGAPPTGIVSAGRWIGTDVAVTGPWIQGTLTADDTAPTGLILTNAVASTAETDPGTDALPCALPVTGPFDANWLFEQRCSRADVIGAVVVVRAQ